MSSFTICVASTAQSNSIAPAGTAATFEIVSIKLNNSGDRGSSMYTLPNGFRNVNMPLYTLVYSAYDIITDSQVVGMPAWATSERYDVEAKVDADAAEAWKKLDWKQRWKLQQPMVQALLADRCAFKAHRETKELPVYDLVIAKGGVKMKEAAPNDGDSEYTSSGIVRVHGMAIDAIVDVFSGTDGRLIVDKTGLGDRKFDFELTWTPDDRRAADPANAGPSLFTALEEQLGLKLVPSKGPVEVLVVDHMERPSAN